METVELLTVMEMAELVMGMAELAMGMAEQEIVIKMVLILPKTAMITEIPVIVLPINKLVTFTITTMWIGIETVTMRAAPIHQMNLRRVVPKEVLNVLLRNGEG